MDLSFEGLLFDLDGSQMAFWTYSQNAKSKPHSHKYGEYITVVEGQYTIIIENKRITLKPGDEYIIPKGIVHGNQVIAGTRAIYAFGGKRAKRQSSTE